MKFNWKIFLMGMVVVTLLFASPLQAQISTSEPNGQISKGAVTASIVEQRQTLPDGNKEIKGVVTVKVNGRVVGQLVSQTVNSPLNHILQIVELDPSNPDPEVLFSFYTGGLHCCNKTSVLTSDASGKKWTAVVDQAGNRGFFDANPEPAVDPIKNGRYVLVNRDNRFLYQFSAYAYSYPPTQIWQLNGLKFVDVSHRPEYLPLHRRRLNEMKKWFNEPNNFQANGFLAGYVATKALVGEFEDGWKQMLKYYDRQSHEGLRESDWGLTEGSEIVYDSFPQALRAFLIKTGYINSSTSVPSNPSQRPASNPNSSRNSSSHQGYCSFLPAAGFGGRIVNDRCSITRINNNTYQIRWSNGRQMSITLNPASIDGNSGQLIQKTATSATVKTYQGRVGFCWNCRP